MAMHGKTISARDVVEHAEFEVDEDGLFIVLHGDFTQTCNRYTRDVAATGIRLLIDPMVVRNLAKTDPGEGP